MSSISRRIFSFLVVLIALLAFGCGGHPGSKSGSNAGSGLGGTQPGDKPLTASVIHAFTDAADSQLTTIAMGISDHSTRNVQLAAWLKTRPEIADAGVTPDVDSVWGRLVNGHLYVATTDFVPDGGAPQFRTTTPSPETPNPISPLKGSRSIPARDENDHELPQSKQARVLLSLDKGFYAPPNDAIANTLRDHNYTVLQQTATIVNLKGVQGDGAFYWGTHGSISVDRNGGKFWAAWTADDITDAANEANKADLNDVSLIYFTAAYARSSDGETNLYKTRYAITAGFVQKYKWSFAPHAFIFANCCHSHASGMTDTFLKCPGGAGQTYGWSNSVLVDAAWQAGAFAFDRLLGASKATPAPSVPQRPFDADNVYNEMAGYGLTSGGTDSAPCTMGHRGKGDPALAPSIQTMEMSERIQESPQRGKSKLTLHGQFGSEKGTVKVGGVEVPVSAWAVDKIECEPADQPGPGFAGDVTVISEERVSNAVPLTMWHGQLKYTIDLLPAEVSDAKAEIACDVYFRGDVHKSRETAGSDPTFPKAFAFRAASGSTAKWTVTGNPVPMAAWSAPLTADLPFGLNGTVSLPYGTGYIVSGLLDPQAENVKFSFNSLGCVTAYDFPGTPAPAQTLTTLHDPALTSQGSGVGSDGYVTYSNNIPATFDSDRFTIPSGSLDGSLPVYSPKLTWTTFNPTFMPDPNRGEDNGH